MIFIYKHLHGELVSDFTPMREVVLIESNRIGFFFVSIFFDKSMLFTFYFKLSGDTSKQLMYCTTALISFFQFLFAT